MSLSGAHWVSQFPTSTSTNDLTPAFKTAVDNFIAALKAGGASVSIAATYRPTKRAYLMHYAYRVALENMGPSTVPAMDGVNIDWAHLDSQGKVSLIESRRAARQMVHGYGIIHRPALDSNHSAKNAIDMSISGFLNKVFTNGEGKKVTPTNNNQLNALGASFGVRKLVGDPPHWSSDGH